MHKIAATPIRVLVIKRVSKNVVSYGSHSRADAKASSRASKIGSQRLELSSKRERVSE